MKRLIAIFLFVLGCAATQPAGADNKPFVLVLDAGHGGHDPGALGRHGKEKDVNLAVVLLVGQYISEQHPDVKIVYTRKKDVFVELDRRADIANKAKANLFMSVHANANNNRSIKGVEVFAFGLDRNKENMDVVKRENEVIRLENNYKERYENYDPYSAESVMMFEYTQEKYFQKSLDFATMTLNELKKCTSWRNHGVKQAGFLVLRKITMPRVLIELDYISNADAERFLLSKEGQREQARAICRAFSRFKAEFDRKNGVAVARTSVPEPETYSAEPAATPKVAAKTGNTSVYKIQICASTKKLSPKAPELKGYKADYFVEHKRYKYTYGETTDLQEARRLLREVQKRIKDAFIVRFENGEKVQIIQ